MSKEEYELIDTSKLEFNLPDPTDFYNISDFNENTSNTITALNDLKSGLNNHSISTGSHQNIQTILKDYADNQIDDHNNSANAHENRFSIIQSQLDDKVPYYQIEPDVVSGAIISGTVFYKINTETGIISSDYSFSAEGRNDGEYCIRANPNGIAKNVVSLAETYTSNLFVKLAYVTVSNGSFSDFRLVGDKYLQKQITTAEKRAQQYAQNYTDEQLSSHATDEKAHMDIRSEINPITTIKSVAVSDDNFGITVSVDYFYNTSTNGNGNVQKTFTVSSGEEGMQALYFVNGDIISHSDTHYSKGIPLIMFMYNNGITEWDFINGIAVHDNDSTAHKDKFDAVYSNAMDYADGRVADKTPFYMLEPDVISGLEISGKVYYKNASDGKIKITEYSFSVENRKDNTYYIVADTDENNEVGLALTYYPDYMTSFQHIVVACVMIEEGVFTNFRLIGDKYLRDYADSILVSANNSLDAHNADVKAHNDIQNKITPYYAFELLSITDDIIKGTLRYKNSQDKIISEAFEFNTSDITYSTESKTPCYIYVPKNFYDGDKHIYISKASDVAFSDVIVVAQVVLSTDNKWTQFHIIGDNIAIVNNKIAEHNTSETAHADIRAAINNEIQNHNNSQTAHNDIRQEISDRYSLVQQEFDSKLSEKADLENGKVPASQLPSYVDDVIEGYYHVNDSGQGLFYSSTEYSEETVIGAESGKIYVDLNTNKTYRYSGSQYVVISETIALGETSGTAYRGDLGKIAYEHSQSTHAKVDATKVEKSNTNGNIKIDDVETTVYSHPDTHPASMITGLEDALSDCVTISELNNTLKEYAKSSELPEGVQVIDNLESNVGTSALSANQGRILNERINNIGSVIEVITTSDIDEICGAVIQVAEEVKL